MPGTEGKGLFTMKIALINENSQAAKNAQIEEVLKNYTEPIKSRQTGNAGHRRKGVIYYENRTYQ